MGIVSNIMHDQLLKEIGELLAATFFLSSEVSKLLTKKFQALPVEGLQQVLSVFQDAKMKQEEMLMALSKSNPDFPKELQEFLSKAYSKLEAPISGEEGDHAENLLKNY